MVQEEELNFVGLGRRVLFWWSGKKCLTLVAGDESLALVEWGEEPCSGGLERSQFWWPGEKSPMLMVLGEESCSSGL